MMLDRLIYDFASSRLAASAETLIDSFISSYFKASLFWYFILA
jgi:hypothetical protein